VKSVPTQRSFQGKWRKKTEGSTNPDSPKASIKTEMVVMLCAVGNMIQFRFDVGNGIQTLEKMTAYPLNDNFWHLVHVERNRKQAMLRVDQQAAITLDEKTDEHFRILSLDSPLVIGWYSNVY